MELFNGLDESLKVFQNARLDKGLFKNYVYSFSDYWPPTHLKVNDFIKGVAKKITQRYQKSTKCLYNLDIVVLLNSGNDPKIFLLFS